MLNQVRTSSGCQNNQRVKFVYGPDHREQRIHMPGGMANLLVQSLIICSTQIWRGKASEISSPVVMSSSTGGGVCVGTGEYFFCEQLHSQELQ